MSVVDFEKAFIFCAIVDNGAGCDTILGHLSSVRKRYCRSKYFEFRNARDTAIRKAVNKCIENFCTNKGHIIKSILEQPFCKVVLNYLMVDNDLVLKPSEVKSTVDTIMEGWTRKYTILDVLSARWTVQYALLSYVDNNAFSKVICNIGSDEFLQVVKCLSNDKAAVLGGLLDILNMCLVLGAEKTLTNTRLIALVETSWKILSKILSNRISVACSDNFLVLKDTSTQTPIFAIGSIVEDTLEKNRELLAKIKRCPHFIRFFGGLHNGRFNRIMTDFGLTDSYVIHNGLDQGEPDFRGGLTFFLASGAFVDDTIWIGNNITATQNILDIANKMVVIPINIRIENPRLFISGAAISIAKRKEPHKYLGIFLSTNSFSVSSLAKVHSDVRQLQTKNLLASVIGFVNSDGVFGKLFEHRAIKQHSKNNFKVATTPDTTTLEYYQSIYTHCKQRFNIPDGIEVVKKSVYQYIENHINNYLFGNYNISEVRSNFYNNLAHYSQLGTEDLNSETLATYFHELNFNIIKYCEETYPVQSQYTIDFESKTEISNKGKNKLKQYSRTTPNTPTLPKTTAKHLQTPEQRTSSKLPLIITPFPASLAQAQTPNSSLNQFARPEDFTSLRSPTRQQELLQTSSNLLDFLAENQSEHSETAANKENNSEITEEESIDSENEEDEMTTYIAKIPEFNGEDIETSPQEWLDQVTKAGDTNGWNAARMLRTIPYFLKRTAGKWFENLAVPFND
ncbi:hypothetical protein G9A89_005027 [Geosiphon pyriformis]|nr:hypothetical protein G9A89_005027 [Geosiphon pyriformis]